MTEALLIDKENNREKRYETIEEAQEQAEDLRALGAEVDVKDISPNSEGDVDADFVDHSNGDGPDTDDESEAKAETHSVEVVDDKPDKPERNLSDDPVEWIGDVGEFTYTKNGKKAINKKGLRVLEHWYEIDIDDSKVVVGPEETDHTYCRVRAEASMPDGRTAVAHGSAHVDRGDDNHLLVEMADTRAKSRVLLDITGMGAVAVSELQNEL